MFPKHFDSVMSQQQRLENTVNQKNEEKKTPRNISMGYD